MSAESSANLVESAEGSAFVESVEESAPHRFSVHLDRILQSKLRLGIQRPLILLRAQPQVFLQRVVCQGQLIQLHKQGLRRRSEHFRPSHHRLQLLVSIDPFIQTGQQLFSSQLFEW